MRASNVEKAARPIAMLKFVNRCLRDSKRLSCAVQFSGAGHGFAKQVYRLPHDNSIDSEESLVEFGNETALRLINIMKERLIAELVALGIDVDSVV